MPVLGSIVPTLPVRSLEPALAFYCKLGFSVRHRDEGFAIIIRDVVELHLTPLNDDTWRTREDFHERPVKSGAESFLPGTASCRIEVDDVRALFEECARQDLLQPLAVVREQWWGDLDFGVLDSDRNLITFFQRAPPATSV
jgi:catechol 2,3-dioxygenase-like lactoylglutathione lyase family enzyme